MSIELTMPELTELHPRITVMGVGGAGGNAVNNMIRSKLPGVSFVVANTDAQALALSECDARIQLGKEITEGLGAGSKPEVGARAAEEAISQIEQYLDGCHMLFLASGMGGGTGTGAAPVIAAAARERGILTVGVVTKPFHFEGSRRMRIADAGITELKKHVDTLIIIPNQNLFRIANEKTTFQDAFAMADQVLNSGVRGITDLMMMPGLINLDFADVRTVMSEMGNAMMGTGEAEGDNRAITAAEAAIANPLLDEVSLKGAKGVLVNITGGLDLTLFEVDQAAEHIRSQADDDAIVMFGSAFSEALNGHIRVSVVATGIEAESPDRARIGDGRSASVVSISTHRGQSDAGSSLRVRAESAVSSALASEAVDRFETVEDQSASACADAEAASASRQDDHPAESGPAMAETEERLPEVNLTIEAESDAFVAAAPRLPQNGAELTGSPYPFAEAAFENGAAPGESMAPVDAPAEPRAERGLKLFRHMARLSQQRENSQTPKQAVTARKDEGGDQSLGRMTPESRPVPTASRLEEQLEIPAFLRRQAN